MNKLLLTALLTLTATASTSAIADVKSVPYTSDMAVNGEIDPDWTTVDVDNDGNSAGPTKGAWSPVTSTYKNKIAPHTDGMMYYYHSSNSGNDWLISPSIHLETGIEYKLRLTVVSRSTAESFKIMMAQENTVDALESGILLLDEPALKTNEQQKKEAVVFTVDATGDYSFGIYCYSAKNLWWLLATDFQIVENVFAPGAPTNFTATVGTDDNPRALSVTLNWTNPTTDADGAALSEDQPIESVNLYRDNELLTTLDGTTETFTDNTESLTSGNHTYAVEAVVAGAKSAKISVTTPYVGPLQALTLPYHEAFTDDASFELMWTQLKGEASTNEATWERKTTAAYGNRVQYTISYSDVPSGASEITEDEWLISPPIAIPAPGAYKIGIRATVNSTETKYYGTPNLKLLAGTGCSIADMTTQIAENIPLQATQPATETIEYTFTASEAGEYYFGLHADRTYASSLRGLYYYIYGLDVESLEEIPAQVTELTATVDNPATREILLSWTNPTLTASGNELTQNYNIEIYRDESLIKTITNTLDTPVSTYTDIPETSGIFTYTLKTTSLSGNSTGTPAVVTAPWVGISTVIPGIAENITVVPAADKSLSATISWTNPSTTNVEGTTTELTKAIVYRNDEQIGVVTENLVCGETSSYTDESIPASGIYTYSVEIYNENGKSEEAAPAVTSPWIGPGLSLPYTETDFSAWTIYNLNNDFLIVEDDEDTYSEERTWLLNSNGIAIYSANSTTGTDDWAISPRFEFEEGQTYTVTVNSYVGYGNPTEYDWDLAISPDGTPENMTTIATVTTNAVYKKDAQIDQIKLHTVSPESITPQNEETGVTVPIPAGTATIGFHARTLGGLTVTGFSITNLSAGIEAATNEMSGITVTDSKLTFSRMASKVMIFNIAGNTVLSVSDCQSIDISGLNTGAYIATAVIDGLTVVTKFVK